MTESNESPESGIPIYWVGGLVEANSVHLKDFLILLKNINGLLDTYYGSLGIPREPHIFSGSMPVDNHPPICKLSRPQAGPSP